MAFFPNKENRVKCGRCNTEFDVHKNGAQCPLCGFGKNLFNEKGILKEMLENSLDAVAYKDYLTIPKEIQLPSGRIVDDKETAVVGFWGMFNDFFSGKALLRINANMLKETNKEYISLHDLIENAKIVIDKNNLSELKGFPNDVNGESSVGRLVYHFIDGFYKIGLFEVKPVKKFERDKIWSEDWKNILIRPTKEGLVFARLPNKVFDDKKYDDQTLTLEEKEWMINYLKKIDKEGFKEYTLLKDIASFIQKGNNGNRDLWAWFKENPEFVNYVTAWSTKKDNPKAFEKQLHTLAQTFSAGKISLLREMRIIENKRNDYTIIGEMS